MFPHIYTLILLFECLFYANLNEYDDTFMIILWLLKFLVFLCQESRLTFSLLCMRYFQLKGLKRAKCFRGMCFKDFKGEINFNLSELRNVLLSISLTLPLYL